MKDKICFVVQRYGEEIIGGSESECRMYAERLVPYYDVEVITSCATDHLSWRNEYPEGVSVLNGVTVRRFKTVRERDIYEFADYSDELIAKSNPGREDNLKFEELQGPTAPEALDWLCDHGGEYKMVLFMTYLYYLAALGLPRYKGKSLLIPTTHDEWAVYLPIYREVFEAADGYVYNSEAERRFTEKLFLETVGKPYITIGAGVEYPKGELPDIKKRFGLTKPYLLYCGRVEAAKGCDTLLDYFRVYKNRFGGDMQLVFTGKVEMHLPKEPDIVELGFLSEEEKYAVMQGSVAFCLASQFESLSIVVLESLMMGRPVLVNGECEVLRDHCTIGQCGLWFHTADEFCGCVRYLLENPEIYETMRRNGREYVANNYTWEAIIGKLRALIELVAAQE